ncbi:MAG: type II toxin-antitoxin system RelE/ParE family toxin [Candidatus Thiodiazotropha sp. (ex Ctena orbiculata)]|nr:type II toxin-antitoxin system RelE/ParE family toxin [Candidatus Thiodiazotropha taylori]
MKVVVTQSAFDDLESIKEYYSGEGVPQVGQKFQREIVAHIRHLQSHPDLGRIVPELSTPSIRELIHPPFRIVYLREESSVRIIRVWRSEHLLVFPNEENEHNK